MYSVFGMRFSHSYAVRIGVYSDFLCHIDLVSSNIQNNGVFLEFVVLY